MATDKIQKMAEMLGKPEGVIKKMLDPLAGINTIKAAKAAYNGAPEGSETKLRAIERWNELALVAIQKATTIETVKAAYYVAPNGTMSNKVGLKKLNGLFQKQVEEATTIETVEATYNAIPGNFDYSEPQKLAIKKWLSLCSTPEQAKRVYNAVPNDSAASELTMERLHTLI